MNPSSKTVIILSLVVLTLVPQATATSEAASLSLHLPQHKMNCKKSPSICYLEGSPGPYCCDKSCVDVKRDNRNCGACQSKCKGKYACCDGRCMPSLLGCNFFTLALPAMIYLVIVVVCLFFLVQCVISLCIFCRKSSKSAKRSPSPKS